MNVVIAILTPLAILLPAAGAIEAGLAKQEVTRNGHQQDSPNDYREIREWPQIQRAAPESEGTMAQPAWGFGYVVHGYEPRPAMQMRIERQMTIRISPRASNTFPSMFAELPDRAMTPRFIERKIGNCVSISRIAGVQTNVDRLLLYMSDRRVVSARLERACSPRDFYSGFYLSKSDDGLLCVDRDTLQSRSGANCKLSQIRQLIEVAE